AAIPADDPQGPYCVGLPHHLGQDGGHHVSPAGFFCNAAPPAEIYTLSLHDALPIFVREVADTISGERPEGRHLLRPQRRRGQKEDRKSTRLNSSHDQISYAVFCLKKKRQAQHRAPQLTVSLEAVWPHCDAVPGASIA